MRHKCKRRGTSLSRFRYGLLILAVMAAMAPLAAGEMAPLTIVTANGPLHFKVELADTGEERSMGLMFRRHMAPEAGMLFDFKRDQPVSMWMKNTFIPLDMLFIRRDGTIANIAARTVPRSLTPVSSRGKVRAVLELNGGTAARLGIAPGDKVVHAVFSSHN